MTVQQQFFESIKCGTGRAYLLLQQYPKVNFDNQILKAIRNNYTYDPQAEGSRGYYVWNLIQQCKQKKKIQKAIVKAFAKAPKYSWELERLFDILTWMALEENSLKAQRLVLKRFKKDTLEDGGCPLGLDAVLKIGELDGLKFIVAVIGKYLSQHPEKQNSPWIMDSFQEDNPDIDVRKELEEAANKMPYIRIYLDNVANYQEVNHSVKQQKFDYQGIVDAIKNDIKVFLVFRYKVEKFGKDELLKLAQDFVQETKPERQERYLRIFSRVPFPYGYRPIYEFATNESVQNNEDLLETALEALAMFEHSEIRALAVTKLKEAKNWVLYLPLLILNYRTEDTLLIYNIIYQTNDQNKLHDLLYPLTRIYEKHPTSLCKKPLELMYHKSNCSRCRKDIVEILWNNQVLSPQLQEELQYDSYPPTRELYETYIKV